MSPNVNISDLLPPEFTLQSTTRIASLWSSYGFIYRLKLASNPNTLILKSIHPPDLDDASESNIRKLVSYDVERWFYQHLAGRLPPAVKLATSYSVRDSNAHNLLLEDLSTEFPISADSGLGKDATLVVLQWLAGFHRTFFRVDRETVPVVSPPKKWENGSHFKGVWARGTYWYLDARREELESMDGKAYSWLMPWIEKINDKVNSEIKAYGTLLHGDAKDANIVFTRDSSSRRKTKGKQAASTDSLRPLRCALYDLQYVGLGLVTYDLVYFLATASDVSLLERSERELLEAYHAYFHSQSEDGSNLDVRYDFDTMWNHWELAIVDWYRFMAGWGFWGHDKWVEKRAREIVSTRIEFLVR